MDSEEVSVDGLVSAADLATWIGEPIIEDEDVGHAKSTISYAFTLVEMETDRDLEFWESEGLPRQVRNVVLAVAAYGYTNPDSWGNERVDDWGGGARPVEEIGMYLTATQKRILAKYAERAFMGIGTLKTYRDDSERVPPWFDRRTGGLPDWPVRR